MKLYALRYEDGYLRVSDLENYQCVAMDKASVFPKEKLSTLKQHLDRAKGNGLNNVRIIELLVTESEDFIA